MSFSYSVLFLSMVCLPYAATQALKITRVILASNNDKAYLEFWPYAAKGWSQLIGIKPTLALIADKSVTVDTSLGDVLRFDPIPGIAPSLQAQVIRLLLPAYFENEGCIISDIDQLPLNKKYFIDSVAALPESSFVIYNDKAYGDKPQRFPMCYVAGTGKTFKDVFELSTTQDIPLLISQWAKYGLGFDTDEIMLYTYITKWIHYATRCVKLGYTLGPTDRRRIGRYCFRYDPQLLKQNFYIDVQPMRPYSRYKEILDELAMQAGITL